MEHRLGPTCYSIAPILSTLNDGNSGPATDLRVIAERPKRRRCDTDLVLRDETVEVRTGFLANVWRGVGNRPTRVPRA